MHDINRRTPYEITGEGLLRQDAEIEEPGFTPRHDEWAQDQKYVQRVIGRFGIPLSKILEFKNDACLICTEKECWCFIYLKILPCNRTLWW